MIFLISCATVFKGYEDEVKIYGGSNKLEVYTDDGFSLLPKYNKGLFPESKQTDYFIDPSFMTIEVPLDRNYILHIKDGSNEYDVRLNRKLGFGWFIMDVFLFVLPAIYDGITGAWYYYDDIDLNKLTTN